MTPAPLRDDTRGLLRAWPGGELIEPNGRITPTFRPAIPGERVVATVIEHRDKSIYCKYCYADTLPLTLREEVVPGRGVSEMTICSECAYGLTPPEEIESA